MVLQKRLDYGFIGYRVPATPRATRSARRGSYRKKVQDNQPCAFDLLATVAGKLLLEGECLPSNWQASTGKGHPDIYENATDKKQKDEGNPQKIKLCDRSCGTSFLGSEHVFQSHDQNNSSRKFLCMQNNTFSGHGSVVTSDCLERVGCAKNFVADKNKCEIGSSLKKEEAGLPGHDESYRLNLEDDADRHAKIEPLNTGKDLVSSGVYKCSRGDPVVLNRRSPAQASSDSSAKMTPCRNHISCGPFPVCRDDVKLVSRDNDENSSGCTRPRTATKVLRQPSRIVDRRVRKILASRYWKLHPTSRNGDVSSIDAKLKPMYRNTKTCYKRQRSQRIYPFKKRKLYDCSSALNSDGGTSSGGIFSFSTKGIHGDDSGSRAAKLGGMGASSLVGGQHSSRQSRDSHVKLRIKSFRVPELFIDIPETATVGSLKRTVMEAVTAILEGGLSIGVLLWGKKLRDDNRTLLQAGISHDNKLDTLGFALEPNSSQAPNSPSPEGHSFSLPCDLHQSLPRYPCMAATPAVQQGGCDVPPCPPVANLGNFVESDHDSAPSPADTSVDKSAADSQALVAVPATSMEALAVVPAHRKSKRSEIAQRRIRCPFSVSEVDALVEAVETLGTGRWRDVKLKAFNNAKHRTYVDLKDKWKTLVHTARISPQQRRGEPVPQELLDRVLIAHAYWSHQQTKHQQSPTPDTGLLL